MISRSENLNVWKTIKTLEVDPILTHRYGIIEMRDGAFESLHFRPWPKLTTIWDVMWSGPRYHARTPGDHCFVYYNQPRRFPNFLALSYILSTRQCLLASIQSGLRVLDEIARIKRSDAILCDAWNSRMSPRLLRRFGWEPHTNSRWHRNYIKRFYGEYPATALKVSAAEFSTV